MPRRLALIAIALLVGTAGSAQATHLGLTKGFPDIASQWLTGEYPSATDVFEISGSSSTPTLLAHGAIHDYDISLSGTSDIFAGFGPGGLIGPGGGWLLIAGEILERGLKGHLLGGDPEQFFFGVTGGLLADGFGGLGSLHGGILKQIAGFDGNFLADCAHPKHDSELDSFEVPEPASAFLLGSALVALTGFARRRLE